MAATKEAARSGEQEFCFRSRLDQSINMIQRRWRSWGGRTIDWGFLEEESFRRGFNATAPGRPGAASRTRLEWRGWLFSNTPDNLIPTKLWCEQVDREPLLNNISARGIFSPDNRAGPLVPGSFVTTTGLVSQPHGDERLQSRLFAREPWRCDANAAR